MEARRPATPWLHRAKALGRRKLQRRRAHPSIDRAVQQNRRWLAAKLRFPRRHGFWRKPAAPL